MHLARPLELPTRASLAQRAWGTTRKSARRLCRHPSCRRCGRPAPLPAAVDPTRGAAGCAGTRRRPRSSRCVAGRMRKALCPLNMRAMGLPTQLGAEALGTCVERAPLRGITPKRCCRAPPCPCRCSLLVRRPQAAHAAPRPALAAAGLAHRLPGHAGAHAPVPTGPPLLLAQPGTTGRPACCRAARTSLAAATPFPNLGGL